MIQEYKKRFIEREDYNKIVHKNTTMSVVSMGDLFFDKYLISKGFEMKGFRNVYHPDGEFYNNETKEIIFTGYGLDGHNFYIMAGGVFYKYPTTQEDIKLFEEGKLTTFFDFSQ